MRWGLAAKQSLSPLQKRWGFIYKSFPPDVFIHMTQTVGRRGVQGPPTYWWSMYEPRYWFKSINDWCQAKDMYRRDVQRVGFDVDVGALARQIWERMRDHNELLLCDSDQGTLHRFPLPTQSPYDPHLVWVAAQVLKQLKRAPQTRSPQVQTRVERLAARNIPVLASNGMFVPRALVPWQEGDRGPFFVTYTKSDGQVYARQLAGGVGKPAFFDPGARRPWIQIVLLEVYTPSWVDRRRVFVTEGRSERAQLKDLRRAAGAKQAF